MQHDAKINFSDIPEVTDISKAVKNPFAQRMKAGYSVTINYSTPQEVDADIDTIRNLLKQHGLKSIQLNIKTEAAAPETTNPIDIISA